MLTPNLFILYVDNPEKSAIFYEMLFQHPPEAVFPSYAAFQLENGFNLGLWSIRAKDFVSSGVGHRSELSFMVENTDIVQTLYERWQAASITIEQPLHEAVFGLTFVALDPDGHRIRVCIPDA